MELDAVGIDRPGKGRDWHTAFYYLAEHLRILSSGKVNHKDLYALVGIDGRYVNHENPLVRKRTAGALSRIVHSKQYVLDMQARYTQNSLAFEQAAEVICGRVVNSGSCDGAQLFEYLVTCCWPDVRRGLENEWMSWRPQLDLFRIDQESCVLIDSLRARGSGPSASNGDSAQKTLSAFLRLIAFGQLEFQFARSLIDDYPTGSLVAIEKPQTFSQACLVKFSDATQSAMTGSWLLTLSRPFTIGRYTDCDIVEVDPALSRVHGCIYHKGGCWYFEDMGSLNGSVVERGIGGTVFDSSVDGSRVPVELQRGDGIVLGGVSRYWFGAASANSTYFMARL